MKKISPRTMLALSISMTTFLAACGEEELFTVKDIQDTTWEAESVDVGSTWTLEGVRVSFSVNRIFGQLDDVIDQDTLVIELSEIDHCEVITDDYTVDEAEGSGVIQVERSLTFPSISREWEMPFDISDDRNTIVLDYQTTIDDEVLKIPMTLTRATDTHLIDNLEDCDSQE